MAVWHRWQERGRTPRRRRCSSFFYFTGVRAKLIISNRAVQKQLAPVQHMRMQLIIRAHHKYVSYAIYRRPHDAWAKAWKGCPTFSGRSDASLTDSIPDPACYVCAYIARGQPGTKGAHGGYRRSRLTTIRLRTAN